jgi:PAS domain S-box-containing protein
MNPFDIRTVLFSQILTNSLSSIVLVILWLRNRKRYAGFFYWLLNITFQTTAIILIFLRGRIPNWMSFELSNYLVMSGALFGFIGLGKFFGKKDPQVLNIIFLGTFAASFIYFLEVMPSLPARNLLISLGLFTFSFQGAWLVYRCISQSERHMAHLIGASYLGFSFFSLARIVIILAIPNSANDFFLSGLYDTLILIAYQVLLILLTFGQVLLVNEKLLDEVKLDEEKYSKAFSISPYAITLTRLSDGQIQEVNDGFTSITGYTVDEAIGKTTQELQLWVNAEDRAIVISELSEGKSVRRKEFQFRKKNGSLFTGLISSDIIMLNDQPRVISSIEDISDRKKAENDIKAYSEHLEEMVENRTRELKLSQSKLARNERLAVLGQLSGSIGHELRSPLGVISNVVYLLKISQPNVDPKIKEYHDILKNEVNNADKIITDLLDFSRLKNVEHEKVSVNEIIKKVLDRFPVPSGIRMKWDSPTGLPMVFVDKQQITQVLGNLILNAYQSMQDGGDLTISAREKGKNIEIEVKDTGIGIPKENIEQLFDPLFTTKPRGIGLGLTVSKMLMNANNGKIEVSSEVGKGSIFTIYLPVQDEEQ